MRIEIVWGVGHGTTHLSAFDGALHQAGLANYNLITLSSVIPKKTQIIEPGLLKKQYPVGESIYVVMACASPGAEKKKSVAGLGWVRATDGSGIFYEENRPTQSECRRALQNGLSEGQQRRHWDWEDEMSIRMVEAQSSSCSTAIVAAVYGPPHNWSVPTHE